MNTKGNKLQKETDEKIIRIVFDLIGREHRPINRITVREICEKADIHRSTFYAHYQDVYDLVEKVEKAMARRMTTTYLEKLDQGGTSKECMVGMLEFIREYREFYDLFLNDQHPSEAIGFAWELFRDRSQEEIAYFGFRSERERLYFKTFVLHGLTAIIRQWVSDGCPESPEELYDIFAKEHLALGKTIHWEQFK